MVGTLTRYILPHPWTWTQALLFGAIVAATDPVAAVAVLREVLHSSFRSNLAI